MTGEFLCNIIMLLFFIVPLLLNYYKITSLFDDDLFEEILSTVAFAISIVYFLIYLGFKVYLF